MNTIKAKIGWVTTCFILVVLAALTFITTPSAGAQPNAFTSADKTILAEQFTGGTYLSEKVYQRCEQGGYVRYYPDGKRLSGFGQCWK